MGIDNEISLEDFNSLSEKDELAQAFDSVLLQLGGDLPRPTPEYKFHALRKWRFDRAWPDHFIAVEIEGGMYGKPVRCNQCGALVRARKKDGSLGKPIMVGGGHSRFHRLMSDKEKYNEAAVLGWIVLRFVRDDILGDPFEMVETIRKALANRQWKAPAVYELSEKEEAVVYLTAAGHQLPDIAQRMGITVNSVRGMYSKINQKLCVSTRAASVARALAWGLIRLEKIPFPEEFHFTDILEEDED